jgi:allantoicase
LDDFTRLVDLASARLGGRVLWANDEFFAEKENLLRPEKPVFREHEYTERGKWMDGWETRRRRTPGHDWCLVRLGLPGILRGVVIDTSFFRGNYPEHASLEACAAASDASVEELEAAGAEWEEVLPKSPLAGDAENRFVIGSPFRFTHLRLRIYPDGGVARLRVHGEVVPDWPEVVAAAGEVDLVAVEHGGRWLAASDMFFSHPGNLLMPGRGARMDDGWETKRRRGPGHDWVVLRLGIPGTIRRVEIDTAHFKGNYPDTASVDACAVPHDAPDFEPWPWRELLPRTKLQADTVHRFTELADLGAVTHARLAIHPDGGVSRLRLFGEPSEEGRRAAALERLNALPPRQAREALLACCGSPAWAQRMVTRRPFASAADALDAADAVWRELPPEQWLEAFRAHPEIGGAEAEAGQDARARGWSAAEQAGVGGAATETRAALAAANRAYRERFGHIYVVCATGRGAEEMLSLCQERLANDPETELATAGEEQRKITRLRLEKLLAG